MTSRLNILLLSSWYPNRKDPLDGNFVQNHVKAISLHHIIKVVFATSYQTLNNNYEIEIYTHKNYSEHYIYFPYHSFKIIRFFRKIKAYWMGIREVGQFDLIQANIFFNIGFLAVLLSILSRKKLVLTEHSSQFEHLSNFDKFLFSLFSTFVDHFVVVSSFLKSKLLSLSVPSSKISLCFNTIDTCVFKLKETKSSSVFRFLHISKFDRDIKNVRGILEATKILYESHKNFVLEIIGDGDLDKLEKMIQEVEIPRTCLKITGQIANEDLPKYYAEADCFVLFSRFENNPLVLLEAMCCGLPVIASQVGGIPDFVNSENGILVEDNDIVALENSMKIMLNSTNHYNPSKIRNQILEKVSPESISLTYDQIFRTVLAN